MSRYVVVVAFLLMGMVISAPPPLRVTIDCGSDEDPALMSNSRSAELLNSNSRFDVNSFCNLIQNAIPQVVEDGKIIIEPEIDQEVYGDTVDPVILPPPSTFIHKLGLPKLKPPRLRTPSLKVPKLKPNLHGSFKPPRIGSPMHFPKFRYEEESSAERLEKFKKGVQKMLYFVQVLRKIDQYVSERTRIVIDKLSQTFTD